MNLEEIRKSLEGLKKAKTFFVITVNSADGRLYYIGEGGNGRLFSELQFCKDIRYAAKYESYEELPREIANGNATLKENAYGSNSEFGIVYPYYHKNTTMCYGFAFKLKTREW